MLNLTNVKIMFYRRKLRHIKKFKKNQFTFKERRETTKNGFVAKKNHRIIYYCKRTKLGTITSYLLSNYLLIDDLYSKITSNHTQEYFQNLNT